MNEKDKKESECCSTSSKSCCCCGGKKFLVGILVGLLIAAAMCGFFKAGLCAGHGKMCAFPHAQSQP